MVCESCEYYDPKNPRDVCGFRCADLSKVFEPEGSEDTEQLGLFSQPQQSEAASS